MCLYDSRCQETRTDEEYDDLRKDHIADQMDALDFHFALMQHSAHPDSDPDIDDASNTKSVVEYPLKRQKKVNTMSKGIR